MRSRLVPGTDQGRDEQGKWGKMIACLCLAFLVGLPAVGYAQGETVEKLIGDLMDKNVRVRGKAVAALGEIGNAKAVKPLIAALEDDYYDIRWKAAWALGKIGQQAVDPLNTVISQMPCDKRKEVYLLVVNNFTKGAIEEPEGCREKKGVKGRFTRGNNIVVPGVLNDTYQVVFYLDTGASYVVITEEDAQALRLDLSDAPRIKMMLGDGRVVESPLIKLDSIKIGSAEARDVPTIVSKDAKIRLLGMSFLNNFPNMKINWETGEVVLE